MQPEGLDPAEALRFAIMAFSTSLTRALARVHEAFDTPRQTIERFAQRKAEILQVLQSLDDAFPPLYEDVVAPMLAYGWYPDLEMPFAMVKDSAAQFRKDATVAEAGCAGYFRCGLPQMALRVKRVAPHRASALADALSAHEQRLYYCSVPVFLAQAEGIVSERLGIRLYSEGGRKKMRKEATNLEAQGLRISAVLIRPLVETTALNRPQDDRPLDFEGLNRHRVLHGEDASYGSELASLKAFSHLLLVSDLLKDVCVRAHVPNAPGH